MRVLLLGLVALLASAPSVAQAGGLGFELDGTVEALQDTVRRDTTTRRAPGDTVRRRAPGDTSRTPSDSAGNLTGTLPPGFENLDLRLNSRLEAKG